MSGVRERWFGTWGLIMLDTILEICSFWGFPGIRFFAFHPRGKGKGDRIVRWDLNTNGEMEPCKAGDWVRFDDYLEVCAGLRAAASAEGELRKEPKNEI